MSKWSPATVSDPYRTEVKAEVRKKERMRKRRRKESGKNSTRDTWRREPERKGKKGSSRDPLGSNKPAEVEVTLKLLHGYRPLFPYCSHSLKRTWPLYFFLCLPSVPPPYSHSRLVLLAFLLATTSIYPRGPRNAASFR